ncbi:unnamed protein product [Ceutorhynchus assimilis]|uniref:Programmed cell death protein 2 C-terminal domain-containing protein n=1 Tax=Ceutorhynchus assimilis TaxID=467358 RepID=A0A9N9N1U6_9CUCU|nr:unnamed protein product [Ceutorhynchus assimilis]
MAKNNNVVLLGYEDELITEKHGGQVDYTVNKIGGEPDFPHLINKIEKLLLCILCNLPSRQIVQIYAPLENTKDHRTLYVFACINPTCHNRSESWTCLRVQAKNIEVTEPKESVASGPKLSSTDWCPEADDWGDDDDDNGNLDTANCNVITNSIDNNKPSDDEESSSYDDSVRSGFRNLSIDEKNANNGAQGGAVARLHSPMATAEIEGEEDGEVVTVESPTTPQTNLVALLQGGQTNMDTVPLHAPFLAYFLSVYPEEPDTLLVPALDDHVKELLSDYQRKDADFLLSHNKDSKNKGKPEGDVEMAAEEYEKSHPLHGDKMFHHFVTKIKSNPEQVLRYCREGSPLLLYPLQEPLKKCKHCQKELVFEFQLIPTIISKLRLECDANHLNRLDFGTVLIYTCKNSCWGANDAFKEEIVVVQKETF